jgi:hypothetical protein
LLSAQSRIDPEDDEFECVAGTVSKFPPPFSAGGQALFCPNAKIILKNLQGSSSEFVVSSVFMHPNCQHLNHLVVLNDAEEAAYFHNTLENLTNALDLFIFLRLLRTVKISDC